MKMANITSTAPVIKVIVTWKLKMKIEPVVDRMIATEVAKSWSNSDILNLELLCPSTTHLRYNIRVFQAECYRDSADTVPRMVVLRPRMM